MATSDSPLSVPDVTLAVARGAGSGGSSSGSGINAEWTGQEVGDSVTITTSTLNFTEKANANPLWYVDPGSEGIVTASPLSRLKVDLPAAGIGNLDTVIKHGIAAARKTAVGVAPDYLLDQVIGPGRGEVNTDAYGEGNHIRLISRWRRNFDGLDAYAKWQELNPTAPSWNIKRWRWWALNLETGFYNHNIIFPAVGQQNNSHGRPRVTLEGTTSLPDPEGDKDLWGMVKDKWVTDFHRVKQSSAVGALDGEVEMVSNGQRYFQSGADTQAADNARYTSFVMEQWQYLYSDVPFSKWIDHLYLDDTPHAVVITNKPAWGDLDSTIDPLIPTAWSATSITAKRRSSGAGYLYVFDGNGDLLNSNGVPI